MAKKKPKKFNINERLKKQPVNSDWLRNAGKSLGITAFDVVKDMFPVTTEFVDYNADDVRDFVTSMRQNVGSKRMMIQQIKNLPHMQIISDAVKNAQEDIKSGNLNNQNRFGDEFDFGFDDDIFGDDDDFNFDPDEEISSDSQSTPTTVINTMPLAKAMNANNERTVGTMVAMADQQMALHAEKMSFDYNVSERTIGGLSSINDNLSLLVQFNNDSTAKYHAASLKYYEESIEYLKYLDSATKKKENDKKKRNFIDGLFTAEGSLKLGEYGKRIATNLEDIKDENILVSSIYDILMDTDTLKMIASNPIGELMSIAAKKIIPEATKKVFGQVDSSLNAFLPAILSRINSFEDSDNAILNYINKIFGSKEKLKHDVYLGEYEKGAISWDGESKKALVEVIPTYLRKIESALTGQDERIYNYDKGVFVSRDDLKEEIDTKIAKAEASGYSDTRSKAYDYARDQGMNMDERKQFMDDLNEYLRMSTKRGFRINPFIQRNKDGDLVDEFNDLDINGDIIDLFGGDEARQKRIRKFLTKGLTRAEFIKMATSGISDSRGRTARVLEKINENPTLTGFSALYNDKTGNDYSNNLFMTQQENLVRLLDSRVDEFGFKEIDYLREIKNVTKTELANIVRMLTTGVPDTSDGFGLKPYDYLRDIRSALVDGIKVFPDTMRRYHGWSPNASIRQRIQQEESERNAQIIRNQILNQNNQTIEANTTTENTQQQTNSLGNIIASNNQRLNAVTNATATRNNTNNRSGINVNSVGGREEEEEEDWEREERLRQERDQRLNSIRAAFGIDNDDEDNNNQREAGPIVRFLNERAAQLDSRLESALTYVMFGVTDMDDVDEDTFVIDQVDDMIGDITESVTNFFDGDSDGEGNNRNSLLGGLRNMVAGFGTALLGTRENDGQDGLLSRFTSNFTEGFDEFRTTLFGERAIGNARTRISDFMQGIRERLPRAFISSAGSTMVRSVIASNAGILGSFILPGGPVGSLLLGTTSRLLHQSETFNRFMYGELGADGERQGGFVPKSVIDAYGKYGKTMKVGAGLGILGSFLLPGGPVAGALLGMGTALTVKSEAFQELIFGKDFADKDNRSWKNGVFGKLFKSKAGDGEGGGFEIENPKLATFLGTAGLGVGIAQGVGLLPAMLLPGGPVLGAVLGLAGGIAASTGKFQEFLFGEKDVDGKRYGGLFTKLHNWFDTSVMGGLKLKIAELNDNLYGYLKGKIFNPIAEAFEPVKQAAVYMMEDVKEAIKDMFSTAVNPIVEAFKDYVAKPIGKALKKLVVDPLSWMIKKTFGFIGKTLLNVTTGILMAPIKLLGGAAERFNNRHAIRDERKARREAALENMRNGKFSIGGLFDLAGVMTSEEKKQAMDERNPYRQGKSRRERKRDHKAELKEEMRQRAEKRKEMQEQYEADKAFGKSHGWKYASAKQKAAREQELREKEAWLQEQQLMQSQETAETVSATGDVISRMSTVDTERNTILKDIRNIFWKFVYGKDADYDIDNAPVPYNTLADPEENMVDKANAVLNGTASPEILGGQPQQQSIFRNVIDVIRSRGQSHADGLDIVPDDGYIAELHKGEMVVPEKPAGKLRTAMNKIGKGFDGVTDILSETSADDIDDSQYSFKERMELHRMDRESLQSILDEKSSFIGSLTENIASGLFNRFDGLRNVASKLFGVSEEEAKDRADNAEGMTELEEKQAKEQLDDMRQAHVSRKNVDFIQAELAKKQEKKEERAWRNKLLAALANIGGTVAGAGAAAFDLPGLLLDGVKSLMKNLGISGLLAGIAAVLGKKQYDKYKEIADENDASVWDVYQGDYREERKDVDGQYIYDNGLINQVKHAYQGRNTLLKPLKAAYNAGAQIVTKTKDTFVNVKNNVSKVLGGGKPAAAEVIEMVDEDTGEVISKVAKNGDEVIETSGKKTFKSIVKSTGDDFLNSVKSKSGDLFGKFIELGKKALTIVADQAEKYFPKQMGNIKINSKNIVSCADDIFKKILGAADSLMPKFGKRISQVLANIAGDSTIVLGVVTAGYDILSGLYAGNVGNLFGVPKNHVDTEMRLITSFIQFIGGLSICSVLWLINEITSAMFGLDFIQTLARAIYNALPSIGKTVDFSNDLVGKDVDSMTTQQLITEAGGDWTKFEGKDLQNMSLKELQKLDPNISTAELMEIQRVDYNNKNGTKLDRLAWKDKQSPTLGGKVWDAITTTKAEREAKVAEYQAKVDSGEASWWDKIWLNRHQNKLNDEIAKNNGEGKGKLQTVANWVLNPVGSASDAVTRGIGTFMTDEARENYEKNLDKTKWIRNPIGAGIDWLFNKFDKKGKTEEDIPEGAFVDNSGNITYEGAGEGDGESFNPKEQKIVEVYNEDGTLSHCITVPVKGTTEIEEFSSKEILKPVREYASNKMQGIPQYDEKGNLISYTSIDKRKAQSGGGLFSKITSAIGGFFGGSTSTSSSSTVDNSSTVTTNTGDTYNTTNEIDTSGFAPLTEAINALVQVNSDENLDEEGKAKTGNVLNAIMDPMGFLFKNLLNAGINIKTAFTGEETDPESVNKAINIFNIIRNPFGYLAKITKGYLDGDEESVEVVDTTKEKWNETKENVKNKWNETKEWGKDKWNETKEWGKDKWNDAKNWGQDKLQQGEEWIKKQYNKSDDVADIMLGDNKAKANVLSTGISASGDIVTAIWNKLAPEEAKLAEGEMADFIATMINKMIVKPFQILSDPVKDKFNEAREAVSTWVEEKKNNITDWYINDFKKPLEESKARAKETQQAIFDDVERMKNNFIATYNTKIKEPWNKSKERAKESQQAIFDDIKRMKDDFVNTYNEKIKEPWNKSRERAKKTQQAIFDDMKRMKDDFVSLYNEKIKEPWDKSRETKKKIRDSIFGWVKGIKNGIVNAFNEKIKEPVSEALTPVTTAISGAWSSLKSSFEPIAGIFNAIKEKRWGDIAGIIKDTGSEGREDANADDDNLRSGIRINDRIRPVKYRATENDFIKPTTNTTNNTTNTNTNNKFVFYNQADNRWRTNKIGKNTMKDAGCGPTSLAMAVSQLTGEQITPDTIAKLGKDHLPGYAKYSLFPSVADKLNMDYNEGYDGNFIVNNLQQGIPVMLSGKTVIEGTPYTKEGHVVTATKIKGNKVFINDPRGKGYSGYYPIDAVLTGLTKGMTVLPTSRTDVSRLSSGQLENGWVGDEYANLYKNELGINGSDIGEYNQLDGIGGKTGASKVRVADRVLSYMRAFLANTKKFKYSQPRRHLIDKNGDRADCSSFVSHVLTVAGDCGKVAYTSGPFWFDAPGERVTDPQIGDVVCQEGHVGLYSGNGNYIHMSGRKHGIRESKAIQNGNNKHRGYKRMLKDPNALVDPVITGGNSLLGTVVATSSGEPLNGGGSAGPQASLDKALLIGDSLTVGMESVLEGKYPNAQAMGKGGKWATQWLDSLSELPDAESVGTVIQWLGINGVHNNKVNIADSQELLTKLKEKYPNIPIFNMDIFPTTEDYTYNGYTGEWWRGLSQEFNKEMGTWAASNGVTQLNATNGFIKEDGFLDPSKSVDGIHFNTDGYKGILSNIESGISSYNASHSGATNSGGAPAPSMMGVFEKFSQTAQNLVARIYNSDPTLDLFAAQTTTPTDSTTPTDGTNPDISNISDNAEAAWKFFTGKGYSAHATAGILGNLQQESGIDPTKKQYGGGPGRGIGQWTVSEERFAGLKAHAASKGKEWTDLQSQLEWIDMEMAGKDPSTANILKKNYGGLDGFKKATDTKWAVEAFEKAFERAGKPVWENRYKYANNFYSKFASAGTGPAMATEAETAPTSGSTPKSMNGWAYYRQGDSQWQEDINGKKIGPSGCGMASHAMMLTTMFGKEINPVTVGKWARAKQLWGEGGMAWGMSDAVAKEFGMKLGINVQEFGGASASQLQQVKDEIKAGRPVVLAGKGKSSSYDTPFTNNGHVVLAVGVDGQNRLIINDPRGVERTKAYGDDGMLNIGTGLRGAWSFDQGSSAKIPEGWETGSDFTTAPGATTPTDGTTASAAPTPSIMGVFEKFSQTAQNLLASIYNGKQVDLFATQTTTTPTDGTTPGGTVPPDAASWDGTQYDVSSYDMSDLSAEKQAHINAILQPALHTYKTHNLFPSVTIGQSAHESYWGPKSGLATKAHNLFGIKCGSKWKGKAYTAKTGEFLDGKNVTITDKFRAYDSYADSVIDRADFLSANRYVKAGVLSATTPDAQIDAMKAAGYATDPSYVSKLKKIVHDNKLTRFDTPKPPKEAATGGAGNGDGKTHWTNGFGDNTNTPKTRYTGGAGMGDGGYTRHAIEKQTMAERNIEKTVRQINNTAVNIIPDNRGQQNISKACIELLHAMIEELHAINTNTAETARGVSDIEIVSANEPVSINGTHKNKPNVNKSKDTRHNRADTGYDTARKMAAFK